MSDKNKQTRSIAHPEVLLNGKPATDAEYKRIYRAPAPKSDPDDRATKRIIQVDRGFKLLR